MFRVVLDSNVYISAFCFTKESPPADVYTLALKGGFELWTSAKILLELADKLQNKFDWESSQVEKVIKQIGRHAHLANSTRNFNVVAADSSDNRILECAFEADAHFIITGDKHLLNLKKFKKTAIISPGEFISLLRP